MFPSSLSEPGSSPTPVQSAAVAVRDSARKVPNLWKSLPARRWGDGRPLIEDAQIRFDPSYQTGRRPMIRTSLAMMIAGFFLHSTSALAQIPHSVALTWEASTTPNVTYNIYRSNTSGAYSATPLASVSWTSYDDSAVQAGQAYFYIVRAVDSIDPNNLSAPSNEALAIIPAPSGPPHVNLIWQQDGTNVPGVWYMGGDDGSTMLSTKILSDSQPGWRIVAVGDLNSDGHPDLI